jgi:hypothetical protein
MSRFRETWRMLKCRSHWRAMVPEQGASLLGIIPRETKRQDGWSSRSAIWLLRAILSCAGCRYTATGDADCRWPDRSPYSECASGVAEKQPRRPSIRGCNRPESTSPHFTRNRHDRAMRRRRPPGRGPSGALILQSGRNSGMLLVPCCRRPDRVRRWMPRRDGA